MSKGNHEVSSDSLRRRMYPTEFCRPSCCTICRGRTNADGGQYFHMEEQEDTRSEN